MENTNWLIELAVKEVGCPSDAIGDVTISDQQHFAEAVDRLSPGEQFTRNDKLEAVGKTLITSPEGVAAVSGLVIRDFILGAAFDGINKPFEERTTQEQLCIYVIWHEVSHARDNRERPNQRNRFPGVADPNGRFKVRHLAGHYAEMILGEIFACYFSATAHSQAVWEDQLESDNKLIARELEELRAAIPAAPFQGSELREVAFQAAQAFWVVFFQYAKSIAHLEGNRELQPAIWLWAGAPEGTKEIITEYGAAIGEALRAYPKVPEDFVTKLQGLWTRLAKLHGWEFPEGPNGDGVFWSR